MRGRHGPRRSGDVRRAVTACVVVALVGSSACAKGVVDIDRTQPNKVAKSIFVGEWFFRPTIVETDYNQGLLFEGLEGTLERIRWEIREDQLLAYRSWELLEGAETGNGDLPYHGAPVAAFAITSHFDVRREFNTATGDQTNVIIEDTFTRPWYQRDHMRVDWSVNLHNDPYTLEGFLFAQAGSPYYVQENDVDNPFRAEVGPEAINVVNNYNIEIDADTCVNVLLSATYCGNSEARLKLSFVRLGARDYEQLHYPDDLLVRDADDQLVRDADGSAISLPMFERFGFFRSERLAYDEEYRWTRNNRVFLANRWNIWTQVHSDSGALIAPQDRVPGRIVYYTNVDFPGESDAPDLWEASQQLVGEWDRALRSTVVKLKQPYDLRITLNGMPPMFELKRNACNVEGVAAYLEAHPLYGDDLAAHGVYLATGSNLKRACAVLEWASAGDFTWQKMGDLRHSFLHWVDTPQQAGPLGYGPLAADPSTGEIVSANANVYGAAIDTYAAYAADIVQLMNGEISVDNVVSGGVARALRSDSYDSDKMASSRARLGQEAQASGLPDASSVGGAAGAGAASMVAAMGNPLADAGLGNLAAEMARGGLQQVQGTHIERELLVNDDLKKAFLGFDGSRAPCCAAQGSVAPGDFSPIRTMLEGEMSAKHRDAMMRLAGRSIMMADWADLGMASVADELAGKTWEEVYRAMRRQIYQAVMTHEVGHTLGLRHNFAASADPLNYKPAFWDYYNVDTGKIDYVRNGKHTPAERLMYASVMDYEARFYADALAGIGPYDEAAIYFGYGGLVEVFAPAVPNLWYEDLLALHDYTDIPKIFSGEQACLSLEACPDIFFQLVCDDAEEDIACPADLPTYYGEGGKGLLLQYDEALASGSEADINKVAEYLNRYQISYLQDGLASVTPVPENIWQRGYLPFTTIVASVAADGYNAFSEVPYKFCPDELSWSSNIDCQPYDKGANFREITRDRYQRYQDYYLFNNFKRDRASFNDSTYVNGYLQRLQNYYFGPMTNMYRYYLYGFSDIGKNKDGENVTLNDFPVGADWQAAALDGLNDLVAVLQQPEPGDYCLDDDNVYRLWNEADGAFAANCEQQLALPLGVGKNFYTKWTDEYAYKATEIGSFFDKYMALWSVTNNEGVFYQDYSDLLDSGAFTLSYWRGMHEEMLQVFASIFSGTTSPFAWRYAPDDDVVTPTPVVDIYTDTVDEALPRIEGPSSWTLRYYGIVLPMARFNSHDDYTLDFSNFGRVCLEGYLDCVALRALVDGNSVAATEGVDYTAFLDPLTGYKYIAPQTSADAGGLSARVLDEATAYVAATYQPAFDAWNEASHVLDEAVAGDAEALEVEALQADLDKTIEALRQAESGLNERTAFIDVLRDISYTLEYGE